MRIAVLAAALFAGSLLAGGTLSCSQEEPTGSAPSSPPAANANAPDPAKPEPTTPSPPSPEEPSGEELVKRGRSVYNQICIACHASDPNQAGNLGPPIAGSPLALLETKVLRNEYPPGYTPIRDTVTMIPLPHVEKDLPALAAYLASVASSATK
jgi:mono/diheme cytochrome c family protein